MKNSAIFFAFPLLFLGCNGAPRSAAGPQTESRVQSIAVIAVASQRLATTVQLPAQLIAYQSVDIYPKVTGFIDAIRVDRGSQVRAGELIVRLSAPELAAQRAQAEAALRGSESQLSAVEAKLASDKGTYLHLASAAKTPGVVAENDVSVAAQTASSDEGQVQAAENNVAAARAAVRSVAQLESYLNIYAPFDGVVTTRNLHPGALVGPASGQPGAMPIVQIVDTGHLRLVVPVPEAYVGEMQVGQQVSFTVPAYPGQKFHAPIARIAHDIDLATRTMPVELDVHTSSGRLSPGSFSEVEWPVHRAALSLFVPASAVTNDQQRSFVIRVRDGRTEWVDVATGLTEKGQIEVFGDLHDGDTVVRNATDAIQPGQRIKISF
ncbi:MAG TPA: efflux RND transporter periplasmic adaptor subunit [Acidobacteriaceae bacterium]|nr:efflux RND transporter periplasmic adaptor subunit [Acidobacteriaceae bacterium]